MIKHTCTLRIGKKIVQLVNTRLQLLCPSQPHLSLVAAWWRSHLHGSESLLDRWLLPLSSWLATWVGLEQWTTFRQCFVWVWLRSSLFLSSESFDSFNATDYPSSVRAKLNKYKFKKKIPLTASQIFLHLFSYICFCCFFGLVWFWVFLLLVLVFLFLVQKTSPLKYIQYILLQKSIHLQQWNLQLLVI